MTQNKEIQWIPLGMIVKPFKGKAGADCPNVSGIDIYKSFIPTRANLEGTDISKYYRVPPKHFACNLMHIGRDERIPIAYNNSQSDVIVTSAYYVFGLKADIDNILEEYLNILFHVGEFDRRTYFYTDSSVRGNLKENRFLDINIPIPFKGGKPDLERQQEVVDIWKGLRQLREENLAIAEPLLQLCQSKIEELKHTAPMVELNEYIEECDERNVENTYTMDSVRGLSTSKEIISTKANMEGVSLSSYKLFRSNEIAYVPDTSRRGDKISLGFNQTDETYLVSSISCVFSLKNKKNFIMPFINLWFCRPEFDRYARYNSWGSARETFSFSDMKRVKVPKPDIAVQQAIVDIYKCAQRAKKIAEEAEQQLKTICPALIQYVIHNHNN